MRKNLIVFLAVSFYNIFPQTTQRPFISFRPVGAWARFYRAFSFLPLRDAITLHALFNLSFLKRFVIIDLRVKSRVVNLMTNPWRVE